jgi:hypothetical protein
VCRLIEAPWPGNGGHGASFTDIIGLCRGCAQVLVLVMHGNFIDILVQAIVGADGGGADAGAAEFGGTAGGGTRFPFPNTATGLLEVPTGAAGAKGVTQTSCIIQSCSLLTEILLCVCALCLRF